MARKFFKRFVPSEHRVNTDKKLRMLRPLLNKPYLWHLRRHSVAKGFAIGAFWSMWPIVGQTIPALILTVKARGNVAIAFAALWLSNPITLVPHWWSAYVIGRWICRTPPIDVDYHRVTEWAWLKVNLIPNFWNFFLPVFIGSILEGVFLALVGYSLIMYLWKRHSIKRWQRSRHRARAIATTPTPEPELANA